MKQRILSFLAVLLLLPGLAQAKIFLADTDDTLRVVTASGVSTIHMYASWADLTTSALTPGSSTARVTTATTTVLVAAPAASTQRQIKGFSVRNAHASSSNVITIQFFDGTNATELIQYTLLAGETLQWGEDENFRIIDASGQVKGAVTANAGTNLNTSSLLTTSAHDAAFGTAGSADTQVRTVQGISSMTPLLVNPGTASNFGITNFGSAFPTPGTAAGFTDGTNMVAGRVVTSTPSSGDAGLVVRPINPNLAADNSTNSTSKVPVLVGVATSSAPTYTNTNQVPLSLDLSGALRVTGGTAATQYAEDAASAGGESLTLAGTIRQDTPAGSTTTDGDYANLKTDSVGRLWVNNSGVTQPVSGTVAATQSGTWTMQPGNTANTTAWLFKLDQTSTNNDVDIASALPAGSNTIGNVGTLPVTSGGTTPCYFPSAASTNAQSCKASAGQLYGYDLINTTTTIYYLRLYNLAAAPTCSSSTGFVRTIPIPPAGAAGQAGGIARSLPFGEAYGTGIAYCITGGGGSTDNTNAATGVYVSLNYK